MAFDLTKIDLPWHATDVEIILNKLETNLKLGLSNSDVKFRKTIFGQNILPKKYKKNILKRFISQVNSPLILILLFAGLVTLFLRDFINSSVIFAVVIINALIGLLQEGKAENALAAVGASLPNTALVIREEAKQTIAVSELVPGDIVFLETGDRVPADLRIIESHNLRIEESLLTGESVPVEKNSNPVLIQATTTEQSSMMFSGTAVVNGRAVGVVVTTGASTEVGKIGILLEKSLSVSTPLTKRLDHFAIQITLFILLFGLIAFIYAYFINKNSFLDSFLIVIGMAVAAIPEELPALITIILAISTVILSKNNAIVRNLPSVETLGSVTVICSDKTGTLTKNEMTAVSLILKNLSVQVSGVGYDLSGEFFMDSRSVDPLGEPNLIKIISAAALCNEASLQKNPDGSIKIIGDPTEGALLILSKKSGVSLSSLKSQWQQIDQIPFESEKRFMATLHKNHEGNKLLLIKGAPEKILELCNQNNDPYWINEIEKAGALGQRVLGFAEVEVKNSSQHIPIEEHLNNLNFLGLISMIDPPRVEAIQAISECQQAGITIKMITGDHSATAASIGKQLGLASNAVLTGNEINLMTDDELIAAVATHDVIARANPEHKMRLVAALKKIGHFVAMTGDGVNDAPALKQADIGVAMGRKGTDAAREASDLVLTDDNFATIARAVKQGRVVYDNIKKSLIFLIPTNGGEAGLIFVALLLGLTMPVTVSQILWVNMVTTITLGFALAFEKAEVNLMNQSPRRVGERLITKPFLYRVIFVSFLMIVITIIAFQWELSRGSSIEIARTTAVNVLVFAEITYLFNVRHFTKSSLNLKTFYENKVALQVTFVLILFQIAFTYFSLFQKIFATADLDFYSWSLILSLALLKFFIIEIEKYLWRRQKITRM
jgi:magnesium-transporting ATPase (P-type)